MDDAPANDTPANETPANETPANDAGTPSVPVGAGDRSGAGGTGAEDGLSFEPPESEEGRSDGTVSAWSARLGGLRPMRVLGVLVVAGIVLCAVLAFRPSDYYEMSPGPDPLVSGHVIGATDPSFGHGGRWYFTTVDLQPVNWAEWAWGHLFGGQHQFIPELAASPAAVARQEAAAQEEMAQAKKTAAAVALAEVHGGRATGDGAEVLVVEPAAPAGKVLRPGDLIVSVDGVAVHTATGLIAALHRLPVGPVHLGVRRDGTSVQLQTVIGADHQLGVQVLTHSARSPHLTIRTPGIGGPSGGLMFSLAFTDAITPGDLTGGRSIAGTGTISPDGKVGPISGIEEKVAGAARHHVQVFFAPAPEAPLARRAAPRSMTVVPVTTYTQALSWLCHHGGHSSVCAKVSHGTATGGR